MSARLRNLSRRRLGEGGRLPTPFDLAMSYKVYVDDNFHYMDEDERYTLGKFDSLDAAIAACKNNVDAFVQQRYEPGMSAEALYAAYVGFGEDPFIVGSNGRNSFSAWNYAKERCAAIVRENP